MHKSRIAVVIASLVGVGATFLPWQKIIVLGMASTNAGTRGDGWISMGICAIAMFVAVIGNSKEVIADPKKWLLTLLGLLVAFIGVYEFVTVSQNNFTIKDDPSGLSVSSSAGIGLYLVVVAGLLIAVLPYVLKDKKLA